MSNLANIYANLQETYRNVSFLLGPPPTYIKTITGKDHPNKIILVHQYRDQNGHVAEKCSARMELDASSDRLDVTGSPLKDDVKLQDLDLSDDDMKALETRWTAAEECYAPVSLQSCQTILQQLLARDFKAEGSEIWVLCDGLDESQTLMQCIKLDGSFNRATARFLGWRPLEQLTMQHMQRQHDTHARFLPRDPETMIELWYQKKPHLTLRLQWITRAEISNFAIDRKANVCLSQSIQASESQSPAEYFWDQIQLLNMLKNKIIEIRANGTGTISQGIGIDSCLTVEVTKEKAYEILMDCSQPSSPTTESTDIGAVTEEVKCRTPLDVTERLWSILQLCTDYDDLKNTLTFIFKTVARSKLVNIPTGDTRMAELISQIFNGRLAIPMLTAAQPYELLLEIGLQKLYTDYQIIFRKSKICNLAWENVGSRPDSDSEKSANGISNIRKTMYGSAQQTNTTRYEQDEDDISMVQNSHFNEQEVRIKLDKLTHVHLLLEHLLSLETHLQLPTVYQQIVDEYLARPPMPLREVHAHPLHHLEVQIHSDRIIDMVKNDTPYARRISMTTTTKIRTFKTVFYQSRDPILPVLLYPSFLRDESNDGENDYWCMEYVTGVTHING